MGTHYRGEERKFSGDLVDKDLARILVVDHRLSKGKRQLLAIYEPVHQFVPLAEVSAVVVPALAVDYCEIPSLPRLRGPAPDRDRVGALAEFSLHSNDRGLYRRGDPVSKILKIAFRVDLDEFDI
ncbi:MAG: hypothetical protein OXH54_16100 [Acidimicrobiaceae bacterium]|nr:hypothetical protein [Acidimicrobiaceae bacterium]